MTTHAQLPVLSVAEATARASALRERGARILRGTFVDSAGVLRAKQVPIERARAFHSPGLGASPVWVIFCADDAIAFTPSFGVVGDMRLRADLDAAVALADGSAWAPTELADQDGQPLAFWPRCSSTPPSWTTCTGTSTTPGWRSNSSTPSTGPGRSSCRWRPQRRCRR